jgi:hypothetical protein
MLAPSDSGSDEVTVKELLETGHQRRRVRHPRHNPAYSRPANRRLTRVTTGLAAVMQ